MDWEQHIVKAAKEWGHENEKVFCEGARTLARYLLAAPQESLPVVYLEGRPWMPREHHLQIMLAVDKAIQAARRRETELTKTNRRLQDMFKKAVEAMTAATRKRSVKQMRGVLKQGYTEVLSVPSDAPN